MVRVPLVVALVTAALPVLTSAHAASASPAVVPAGGAQVVFASMSPAQRIGQLFMVGGAATGVGSATLAAITDYHVGNVILTGRSSAGVTATRSISDAVQNRATRAATGGVPLFVATDQEGGQVQVLSGPGFARIPEALTQGTWSTSTLRASAHAWGAQLQAAGVNVDLAPVMDTVPVGQVNPPIGHYHREFGHTPAVVGPHGTAFAQGLASAGIATTAKHFPGLGRVTQNTDTNSGVTDDVTSFDDAYLAPFAAAVDAGAPFVMMSSAYYSRIDPGRPAVFSPTVINGMLRDELGFTGVVISDDLGGAVQVSAWPPGERAVDFIAAGGDMVLTVNPAVIPAMIDAVSAAAARSASFRAKLDAAVLRVLAAKQAQGLIPYPDVAFRFDVAGHATIALFRPATGTWLVRGQPTITGYGGFGDIPVPADWTGDGSTDIALFRPSTGTWYIRGHHTVTGYGRPGDIPVPADWTGDGTADIALFRPATGTWYIRGHHTVTGYGRPGDIPVPADWTGDGTADIALFRPATGTWYIRGHHTVTGYGRPGDIPVPADWTGDGSTDIALFRPATGTWYIRGHHTVTGYGRPGDIPVPADWTGDGSTDIALFRAQGGLWFNRGHHTVRNYGRPGDIPV